MKANKTLPFLTISLLLTALSWPNNGMGQNVWEFSLGTVIPVGDFSGGEDYYNCNFDLIQGTWYDYMTWYGSNPIGSLVEGLYLGFYYRTTY